MTDLNELRSRIDAHKHAIDAMRPLSPSVLAAIREPRDFEITWTSNAIEGNTLTLRETAEVIQHGVTVGGKPVGDHLEAGDHHHALAWMYEVAGGGEPLTEMVVRQLHGLVLKHSKPDIAGRYATTPRRIAGSEVIFPEPYELAVLMRDFGDGLKAIVASPDTAFDAHYQLVTIHPFADGNGRTARLLMNLVLVRGGYQPVAIRPSDRLAYLDALEAAQLGRRVEPYQQLMLSRLDATMQSYREALEKAVTSDTTLAPRQ